MSEKQSTLTALLNAFNEDTDLDSTEKTAADNETPEQVEEAVAESAVEDSNEKVAEKADAPAGPEVDVLPALQKLASQAFQKDIASVEEAAADFGRAFATAAMEEITKTAQVEEAFSRGYDAMAKVASEAEVAAGLAEASDNAYMVMAQDLAACGAYEKVASHLVEMANPTAEEIASVHDTIVKEAYDVMAAACRKKGIIGGD